MTVRQISAAEAALTGVAAPVLGEVDEQALKERCLATATKRCLATATRGAP